MRRLPSLAKEATWMGGGGDRECRAYRGQGGRGPSPAIQEPSRRCAQHASTHAHTHATAAARPTMGQSVRVLACQPESIMHTPDTTHAHAHTGHHARTSTQRTPRTHAHTCTLRDPSSGTRTPSPAIQSPSCSHWTPWLCAPAAQWRVCERGCHTSCHGSKYRHHHWTDPSPRSRQWGTGRGR